MTQNRSKPLSDLTADDTVVEVGTGPHEIHSIEAQNLNAADLWLHIWDAEAVDVTLGVDVPTLSYLIPAGDGALYGAMDKPFPTPIGLAKGFCYAVSDAPAGGAAPVADAVVNFTYRKVLGG